MIYEEKNTDSNQNTLPSDTISFQKGTVTIEMLKIKYQF